MRKVALTIAVAFALSGCGKPLDSTSAAVTSEKPSASDSRKTMPDFVLTKLDGTPLKSSDLKGKVTLLDFWATWCDPCKEEIPDYNKLQERYAGKDFQILGVTMESGTAAEIQQKAKELNIKYPLSVGNDQVVDAFGGLLGFPTIFLITKDGKIQ